jgi:hypothetical protein
MVVHGGDVSVSMPDPARRRTSVRGRGCRIGGGLGDCVTRRGVRHHVGQRADRDESAGRQPPVDPCEASDSDVAHNL